MTDREASQVVVTMKEYVDALFDEKQRVFDVRCDESQRAVDKAEKAMCDRLAGMNEFRDQLKDQAARFITRDELNTVINEVGTLRSLADVAKGKASQTALLFTSAIALAGLVISILNLVTRL